MVDKIIRGSDRGLTFSFPATGALDIGSRYDYVIDRAARSIRISASPTGRYKLSRKRAGVEWNPLVDLRNREVLDLIAGMEQIRVSVGKDAIVVSDARAKTASKVIVLQRSALRQLRMAAGMGPGDRMDYVQLTLDEFLRSSSEPLDVHEVHSGLADVYTLVSLFSGAGVLDWPFAQDDRFRIQYAIDYEAAACETYRVNIGTHIVHGDIHKAFTPGGFPQDSNVDQPDIVIGGPSCKPFSNANRHTRLADHPDSDLVVQYMRIIKALRPKVFAMENVPEVLTACGGAYFDAIREAAREPGYELEARVIQDNKVGGYTIRKRAIVFGSRIGPIHIPDLSIVSGGLTVGDAIGKVDASWENYEDVTLPGDDTKRRMSFVPQGGNYTSIPEEYQTGSKNRHSCTYRRLALDEPSPTIVNWRKPPLIHPTEDRTLTVAEAKALQGLPGHFRVCGTLGQKQQQIGNCVPVAIGTFIKNVLLSILNGNSRQTCLA